MVNLPDGQRRTTSASGTLGQDVPLLRQGRRPNSHRRVSPAFTVPAGGTLTAKVKYDLEADYDYTFAEVSTDGGATWSTPLATNLSTDEDPNGIHGTSDITGSNCATATLGRT